MMGVFVLLGGLSLAIQRDAATVAVPPKIAEFLQLCETSRRGAILQLEHTLRGLRAQHPQTQAVVHRIAEAEANLQILKANQEPVVPPLRFPPEVGAIGRLPRLACHVDQVLSENEMLVRCFFPVKVPTVRHYRGSLETISRPITFLVHGVPTREVQVGSDLELVQVFEISAARTYRTTAGQNATALVLAEFDMKTVEPFFQAGSASR